MHNEIPNHPAAKISVFELIEFASFSIDYHILCELFNYEMIFNLSSSQRLKR